MKDQSPAHSSNVIQLKPKVALFNPELRTKLEAGVRPLTDKPEEVINTAEQIICTHLVSQARKVGDYLARKLGEVITGGK